MPPIIVPSIARTGQLAELSVTTRESNSIRAAINVRLALPRRRLNLRRPDGELMELPQSDDAETGIVVAQFPVGVN